MSPGVSRCCVTSDTAVTSPGLHQLPSGKGCSSQVMPHILWLLWPCTDTPTSCFPLPLVTATLSLDVLQSTRLAAGNPFFVFLKVKILVSPLPTAPGLSSAHTVCLPELSPWQHWGHEQGADESRETTGLCPWEPTPQILLLRGPRPHSHIRAPHGGGARVPPLTGDGESAEGLLSPTGLSESPPVTLGGKHTSLHISDLIPGLSMAPGWKDRSQKWLRDGRAAGPGGACVSGVPTSLKVAGIHG